MIPSERPAAVDPAAEDRAKLESLAADLDALSNLQRLRLLHLLTRPRYAEEIAEALGMSRQSALKHIEKLEERGFVRAVQGRRVTGPVIEYLVVPQRLFAVGISIGDLGKLEPAGGPDVRIDEKTVVLSADGASAEASAVVPLTTIANLVVATGPAAGTRFALDGDRRRWTIGRDEDRDARITHDPFISGRHAEVQLDKGVLTLVDVFSANGTFLNFARIPRGGRVPLKAGDVIGVGHTVLVYQRE